MGRFLSTNQQVAIHVIPLEDYQPELLVPFFSKPKLVLVEHILPRSLISGGCTFEAFDGSKLEQLIEELQLTGEIVLDPGLLLDEEELLQISRQYPVRFTVRRLL